MISSRHTTRAAEDEAKRRKGEASLSREADRKRRERERRQQAAATGRTRDEARSTKGLSYDPYKVLGVTEEATQVEIKAAYRETMSKYHPDKVAHLATEFQDIAKKRALEINSAFEILKSTGRTTSPRRWE